MVDNYRVHCYRNLLCNLFQICRVLCTSARPRATHGARVQPHHLHELGECLLQGGRSVVKMLFQNQEVVGSNPGFDQ